MPAATSRKNMGVLRLSTPNLWRWSGYGSGIWSLLKDFRYDESQRPVVAQVYGHTPALFEQMAILLCALGFDGIDLNMGARRPGSFIEGRGRAESARRCWLRSWCRATRRGVEAWQNGANVQEIPELAPHLVEQVVRVACTAAACVSGRAACAGECQDRGIGYAVPQVRGGFPGCWSR
jgi:hypothetical protein